MTDHNSNDKQKGAATNIAGNNEQGGGANSEADKWPSHWLKMREDSLARIRLVSEAATKIREISPAPLPEHLDVKLAAVEVFVEKAINHLSDRAGNNFKYGFACSILSISFLTSFIFYGSDTSKVVLELQDADLKQVIPYVISKMAITGAFGYGVYIFSALARSFFNQSAVQYNRRHAMRYGRLYLWLNDAKAEPEIIADMFGGNFDNASPFSGVNSEIIMKGPVAQLGDVIHGTSKKIEEIEKDIEEVKSKLSSLIERLPC